MMRLFKWALPTLTLLILVSVEAAPPALEARDVAAKVKEMTKAHATHKELDTELVQRALVNYIELLDPAKTYFVKSEVEGWVNASDSERQSTLRGYKRHNYSSFETISAQMEQAIARRHRIEAEFATMEMPENVGPEEFKDLDWAADEAELRQRLLHLRAHQLKLAASLGQGDEAEALALINKRRTRREQELLGETPKDQQRMVYANVLKATASALDSQTAYFTPEEASNFLIDLQQRLFGIGVQLRDSLNGFTVVRVIEGGPAYEEGSLRPDDQVIAVDGETVIGLDIQDAVKKIRGQAHTPVRLTVMRKAGDAMSAQEVTIYRGEVVLKEARIETSVEPYADGVIGRIALYSFYQDQNASSASDVLEAINELKSQYNLKGLVLDLRRNTGGLLPQAIAVTGLFITKGVVASIRDNDGHVQYLRDAGGHVAWDGPLIVHTSRLSASASEIVAGALQDYGRALIVGDERTFGKGTFQTSTIDTLGGQRIDPKGEYKVTRGTYFTVSGRSPQLTGIQADVVTPGVFSQMEIGERYSKYPIAPAAIEPNFEDDLSDIPYRYRDHVRRTYHYDLQQRLTHYTCCIETLRHKSTKRLDANPDYQMFLAGIEAGELPTEVDQQDHQLQECYNVMKDFITVLENNSYQR